jgi:HK97 family phage major capsid protein
MAETATAPVSKATAKALREQRADLILQAQSFAREREDAQGLLSAEDQGTFDEMTREAFALDDPIKQRESRELVDQLAVDLSKPSKPGTVPDPAAAPLAALAGGGERNLISVRCGNDPHGRPQYKNIPASAKHGNPVYRDTFSKYLATGKWAPGEYAALQSDDAEQAGFLVTSEQFASEMLKEVDDLLFIRKYAKVHTSLTAKSLGIRARTGKLTSFNWSSELTVSTADNALKYGKRVLEPHHLTGQIEVSRDLLRNAVIGVETEVRGELARDSGEVMETAYLTGSGAQQPLGVFTASNDGIPTTRDIDTGSATGITYDGLLSAKYSLKSQYRNGGVRAGARWLFHRDGLLKIAQLKDGDGHPMLRPGRGLMDDDPDTILGFPVDESERAPNTFTASQYVGLLAQWRYYEIADSLDLEIQVLFELLARSNQVVYIGRIKTDGMPTLSEAFARLKTSAS